MIKETEFVVETGEETKKNNVLLRDIPNNTAFLARSAAREKSLYMKFGGTVVCLDCPDWCSHVSTTLFLDYVPIKSVKITVERG